ncbi:metalloprotease [Cellulophaga lytica]|uniref:metalloprotease n=1 Tax=Cellulophaga lytica TaxID=979 RepID=UPI0004F875BE|nr:metalloprotease [Cellulophaga lytica]AIM60117.1 metalloprotease [Cellulophaga lytica]APU09982.1 metalloprotease [Cellulophaga lytica]MDO6854174.1 metalloprotease [Cellulophaga lytica]
MKNLNFKRTYLLGLTFVAVLQSCSKDTDSLEQQTEVAEAQELAISEAFENELHECGYVDGNWSSTAYLSSSIGTSSETNFMQTQNSKIAAVWGRPAVPLSFVKDNSNPNSTYNAISYGSGKIYYGEAIYNAAKAQGQIANVMILAHEFAHQLQFTYGYPSKNESTARAAELEADGMAGYYLRRPNGYNKTSFSQIATAYEFAASIGDNNTTSPGHHGRSYQRRSAVRLGFLLGAYDLNAASFDYNFFYYYNGVLNGSYKQEKSEYFNAELDKYIRSYAKELQKISNGEMSDEEYFNLD